SFISINWRGRPLPCYETVIDLIAVNGMLFCTTPNSPCVLRNRFAKGGAVFGAHGASLLHRF
ncbi:MAG TPA: hypothetical protein VI072_03675, partial [Polyangiaceae bacterium]